MPEVSTGASGQTQGRAITSARRSRSSRSSRVKIGWTTTATMTKAMAKATVEMAGERRLSEREDGRSEKMVGERRWSEREDGQREKMVRVRRWSE